MRKIVAILAALALMIGTPTSALAKGYSGGRTYHSTYRGTGSSYSSGSHTYSSSGMVAPSSNHSSTYRSSKSYSGGSTYHSGYTASSRTGSSYRGSYTSGSRSFGLGHFGSFAGGFILGSMVHPFGWGFGGGYYGGPGYYGGGWGGPGYSPVWSFVGIIVDILVLAVILRILFAIFRRRRRKYASNEPIYDIPYEPASNPNGQPFESHSSGSYSSTVDLDEQAVADACCEFVAARDGCAPEEVDVDLTFDRDAQRFGANIRIDGRIARSLYQQDLVDAVAEFVASRERVAPQNVEVDLQFNEQMGIHTTGRIR